jgi:hypothetical protein
MAGRRLDLGGFDHRSAWLRCPGGPPNVTPAPARHGRATVVSERWELSVPLPASPHGGEGPGGCGDMAVVPALVPLAVDCIVVQGAVVLATAGAGLASANAPLPPWETFVAGVRREVLERIADLGQRRSGQPISPLPDQVAGADYAALAGQGLENGRGDRATPHGVDGDRGLRGRAGCRAGSTSENRSSDRWRGAGGS